MKEMLKKGLLITGLLMASLSSNATTFGPVENFDVVNDTGTSAHGFHIRLHGIQDTDISSMFGAADRWPGMIRYNPPVAVNGSDANGVYVDVIYEAAYDSANKVWSAGTPSGTLPVSPTDSCWPGGTPLFGPNYPCDHYGVSTYKAATSVDYLWMLETATPGVLTETVSNVPTPLWTVTPAVLAAPAQPALGIPAVVAAPAVVAVNIAAPPKPVPFEFGEPKWVKVTATGVGYNVAVEDLVAGNAVIQKANTNVQIEWQRLQTDTGNPVAGNIDLTGVKPDPGYKSVVYRFEFYSYTGAFDPETHEAITGPDTSGSATPPATVGKFLVAQMAGVNLDGQVPVAVIPVAPTLTNSLTDGVAGVDYYATIDATAGNEGDAVNVTVTGLPPGLFFDGGSVVSGKPTQLGTFQVTVNATDAVNNLNVSAITPITIIDMPIVFKAVIPDAKNATLMSYQLAATGGDAPFTYAITKGALPKGLSLTSQGLISGTPTVAGSYPLTFTATDSVGSTQSVSTTMNVISQSMACSGTAIAITSVSGNNLNVSGASVYAPAVVTFAPGLKALAAKQLVTYSGATDAANVQCLATTMTAWTPLTVATPTLANGTIGVLYPSVTIKVSGGWSPYTLAVTGLPTGMKLSGTAISGTPTVSGTFKLAISAADAKNNKFSITTSTITIGTTPVPAPAPAPAACTVPAGSKTAPNIQANVTAVNGTTVTIGSTLVTVPACAAITWKGNWSGLTKAIRVGYNVQVSKGYVLNGITTATAVIVDNLL